MPGGQWQPEWIAALSCPVLLVTRPDLGTLNHTHLTAEALAARGLPALGLIINGVPLDTPADPADPSVTTNLEVLARIPGLRDLAASPATSPTPAAYDHDREQSRALAHAVWTRLKSSHP